MRNAFVKMLFVACLAAAPVLEAQAYKVTNIISDGSVPATTTDAGFLNPWAMSVSGTWWISTANTGFNYVVPATTGAISFKVNVPSASGTGTGFPAGSVTTGGASGMLLSNGTKASFLFSTLDGTISGWNSKLGTAGAICTIMINNGSTGASYPGLAILNQNATTSYILAPNFSAGPGLEVYDSTFHAVTLGTNFKDPNLPVGYAPFSVHVLNNQVWVAYALRTSATPYRTVNGVGNGIVSVFDTSGNFVARAVTGGNLNAPWGVAFAPASFGVFSGDLLIGNFGDGLINVYDPHTYAYLGQMMDSTGKSLQYASLWELLPGGTAVGNSTAVSGGDTSTVYFTAGLTNEAHGLLAGISNGAVAGSSPTFGFTPSAGSVAVARGSSAQVTVSAAPVNGFSGTVQFACSGLPAGANCSFSPSSVNVSATAPGTSTLTITASQPMARLRSHGGATVALAMLMPFWLASGARRRRLGVRLLAIAVLASAGAFAVGCADNGNVNLGTPTGTSTMTITATSGATTQSTTVGLTVN